MENTGEIYISRKIVDASSPAARIEVDEYLTSCWGTTEYPEDLTGCLLHLLGKNGSSQELSYDYRCREESIEDVQCVSAVIPQVQTKVSLTPLTDGCRGYYEEGYSFAPNLKIGVSKEIELNQELVTCLKVEGEK